ncbi:MAG: relaxase/mobilization nuclease domain-containing protein [Defluviitaleaceae bacterium]|nr:relaxase/mobilization nuclease domain-containing protein [Defluviitaleaceae bacterium]
MAIFSIKARKNGPKAGIDYIIDPKKATITSTQFLVDDFGIRSNTADNHVNNTAHDNLTHIHANLADNHANVTTNNKKLPDNHKNLKVAYDEHPNNNIDIATHHSNLADNHKKLADNYAKQMKSTAHRFGKNKKAGERTYYSIIISPNPNDNATPEQSHQLAREIARRLFPKYEAVIATHTNTDDVHSHIILNSVNFEDGKKLQISRSKNGFEKHHGSYGWYKDQVQDIAEELGLTPTDWREDTRTRRIKEREGEKLGLKPDYSSHYDQPDHYRQPDQHQPLQPTQPSHHTERTHSTQQNQPDLSNHHSQYHQLDYSYQNGQNNQRNQHCQNNPKIQHHKRNQHTHQEQGIKLRADDTGVDWGELSWKENLRRWIDVAKEQTASRSEFEAYLKDNAGITMPRNTAKTVSFKHPYQTKNDTNKANSTNNTNTKSTTNTNNTTTTTIRGNKLGDNYTAQAIDTALKITAKRRKFNHEYETTKQARNTATNRINTPDHTAQDNIGRLVHESARNLREEQIARQRKLREQAKRDAEATRRDAEAKQQPKHQPKQQNSPITEPKPPIQPDRGWGIGR